MMRDMRSAFTGLLKDTLIEYQAVDRQTLTLSWISDLYSSGYRTSLSPLNHPVDIIYLRTISQPGSPVVSMWTALTRADR